MKIPDGNIHAYFSESDTWDYRDRNHPNFKEIKNFSKNDIKSEDGSTIEFLYKNKNIHLMLAYK